ncbi:hypothetical protein [uncultured Eubacterium sp.]|uniref:hypothetical protein n=1 Tax=uncultured Eubacterium sp. TaxID=165185 RepID=UPI0026237BB8|nr:hypothetical protein [uncultured Eubacterium sp.]
MFIHLNGKYVAIKVPDTINGITPVAVGSNCFKNSDIVHIELPDTIFIYKCYHNKLK